MSKKGSLSRIDGDVCCCSMVGVSICPSNTGVENELFKGVTGFSSNSDSWSHVESVCVVIGEVFPFSR